MDHPSSVATPERAEVTANLAEEYRTLHTGAGIRLCPERAVIRINGEDRVSFLNGMCSNDIRGLRTGAIAAALFLTERAHLIADAHVWAAEDALLLEIERSRWPAVRAHLERFLVADDVELAEDAGLDSVIQVDGPQAKAAIATLFGQAAALPGGWRFGQPVGGSLLVAQLTRWGRPAFTILGERENAPQVFSRLGISADFRAEFREISFESAEIMRLESGTVRVGIDTDDRTIALEARMESAISFNKGCYVGQETIERATARGALKRRLMGLKVHGRSPAAGARVALGGKEIGRITSPTLSPRLGTIGLGILHHSAWTPGTAVKVNDVTGELDAVVSELPFSGED